MTRTALTPDEWARADALARDLAHDVDRNEFGKIVTYMRRTKSPANVHVLLRRLPRSTFIRSNQTERYLERIAAAWGKHLQGLPATRATLVASWAFRLMTYYQQG